MLALKLLWQTTGRVLELSGCRVQILHHFGNYVIIDEYRMETTFVGNPIGEVWCFWKGDDWLCECDAQ